MQYGDISGRPFGERRLMAGNGKDDGGIVSGNSFPSAKPCERKNPIMYNRLPMLVWQGLFNPKDTLIIVPTIWEWDGQPNDFDKFIHFIVQPIITLVDLPYNDFNLSAVAENDQILKTLSSALNTDLVVFHTTPIDGKNIGENIKVMHSAFGEPKDRPIGMITNIKEGYASFQPLVISLNANAIDKMSNTNVGFGKGVLPITYKDDHDIGEGNYSIYLQFEKINPSDQASINKSFPVMPDGVQIRFMNVNSQKAIDLKDKSTENESPIIQWDFVSATNQLWTLKQLQNGNYLIQNINSKKYLETFGFSKVNGGKVSQWSFTGAINQQLQFEMQADGSYIIRNADSHKVLDVNSGSKDNGANITQWDFTGNDNQKFYINTRFQSNKLISLNI